MRPVGSGTGADSALDTKFTRPSTGPESPTSVDPSCPGYTETFESALFPVSPLSGRTAKSHPTVPDPLLTGPAPSPPPAPLTPWIRSRSVALRRPAGSVCWSHRWLMRARPRGPDTATAIPVPVTPPPGSPKPFAGGHDGPPAIWPNEDANGPPAASSTVSPTVRSLRGRHPESGHYRHRPRLDRWRRAGSFGLLRRPFSGLPLTPSWSKRIRRFHRRDRPVAGGADQLDVVTGALECGAQNRPSVAAERGQNQQEREENRMEAGAPRCPFKALAQPSHLYPIWRRATRFRHIRAITACLRTDRDGSRYELQCDGRLSSEVRHFADFGVRDAK